VLEVLKESGYLGRISVITTDVFPELAAYIKSGDILASIYQRPQAQGRIAFESLYFYVTENVVPSRICPLPPHFVMQSNLDLFLEIIREAQDRPTYLSSATDLAG